MLVFLSLLLGCPDNTNDTTDTDDIDTSDVTSTVLDDMDFTGNVTLADRVEDPDVADYTLASDITIEGTLTIAAGVRIDVAPAGEIITAPGRIVANGTEDAPVIIDGGIGLSLRGAGNELTWTQVVNAGQGTSLLNNEPAAITIGLDNLAATATFDHVTVDGSGGVGVFLDTGSTLTASSLVLRDTAAEYAVVTDYEQLGMFGDDVVMSEGTEPVVRSRAYNVVSSDLTIDFAVAPITLADDLTVDAQGSLTLEAGVELRNVDAGGLYITGPFVTNGTEEQPVVITGPTPSAGSWVGVRLKSPSGNALTHTTIRGGGGDMSFTEDANLVIGDDLDPATATLTNVTLADSAAYGLVLYNLSAPVDTSSVTFTGNASGNEYSYE